MWGSVRSQEVQVQVEATEVSPFPRNPLPCGGKRMSGEQSSSQPEVEVLNTNTCTNVAILNPHAHTHTLTHWKTK